MRVGLIQVAISLLVTPTGSNAVSLTQRRLADPAAVIAGPPAHSRPAPTVDHLDHATGWDGSSRERTLKKFADELGVRWDQWQTFSPEHVEREVAAALTTYLAHEQRIS